MWRFASWNPSPGTTLTTPAWRSISACPTSSCAISQGRAAIDRAFELEPGRDENQRLLALLTDVESGAQPCPQNEAEVAKALS
jgi:hypothetical protein